MAIKSDPQTDADDNEPGLVNKLIRLKPETAKAYEFLKAEQGPRSGPRLAEEAFALLFEKYGQKKMAEEQRRLALDQQKPRVIMNAVKGAPPALGIKPRR
jgi:hypothetical protein